MIALIIVCLSGSISYGYEAVATGLSWRPVAGDKKNCKLMADYRLTQVQAGVATELAFQFGFGIGFEVLEVDPAGNSLIKVVLHSLLMRADGPGGTMIDFDSTAPWQVTNGSNLVLAALPGLTYTVRLDPAGQAGEVKGLQEALRLIDQKLPNIPEKKSLLNNLQGRLQYRNLLGLAANPGLYPSQPVAAGSVWNGTADLLYNDLHFTTNDQFRLVELDSATAVVDVASVMNPVLLGTEQFRGEQRGTVRLDAASGWPMILEQSQELTAISATGSRITMKGTLTLAPLH